MSNLKIRIKKKKTPNIGSLDTMSHDFSLLPHC